MLTDTPMLLAIRALEILFAWSLAIQTLEFLRMGAATSPDGLWSWALQRGDIPRLWMQRVLYVVFTPGWHRVHLLLRLVGALWLGLHGSSLGLISGLFVSNILVLIRWRGAFNGGSDFLTLVVLTGLLMSQLIGAWGHVVLGWQAGLWYITIQALTSYFMSGWVKLMRREWRSGAAMTIFLNAAIYGPLSPRHPLRNRALAGLGSWAFIVWECCAPLALVSPEFAALFCTVAAVFHFLVFWFFGLNRFFWAWLASFPAIVWSATQFQ